MPVEYFLRYKGLCYDVGTRLRFRNCTAPWAIVYEGTIEWFSHNSAFIRLTNGGQYELFTTWPLDNLILEIIHPVYYEEPPKVPVRGGPLPPENDIFIGLVWYIVIMLVGAIFKDRLTIWVCATAYFFLWKNGYFNRGKK